MAPTPLPSALQHPLAPSALLRTHQDTHPNTKSSPTAPCPAGSSASPQRSTQPVLLAPNTIDTRSTSRVRGRWHPIPIGRTHSTLNTHASTTLLLLETSLSLQCHSEPLLHPRCCPQVRPWRSDPAIFPSSPYSSLTFHSCCHSSLSP